jgi:hypothetical protein
MFSPYKTRELALIDGPSNLMPRRGQTRTNTTHPNFERAMIDALILTTHPNFVGLWCGCLKINSSCS